MKRAPVLLILALLGAACGSEEPEGPAAPQVLRFEASEGRVGPGQRFLLEWTVQGAESVTITTREGMLIVGGSDESDGRAMAGPIIADTTFVLKAEGPGGKIGASVLVAVDYPAPVIERFEVQPSVVLLGDPAFLFWQTQQGTDLQIVDDAGTTIYSGLESTGSATISPTVTTAYTLTLSGPGGTATATTSVQVRGAPPQIRAFSAEPAQIFAGDRSLLSWRSAGAQQVQILDEAGQTLVQTSSGTGTLWVQPTVNTTYTLIASNEDGQDQDMTQVEVRELEPPKIVDLRAQPQIVGLGQSTTLSWVMSGADGYRILANGAEILTQLSAIEVVNEPVTVTSTQTLFVVEVHNRLGTASAQVEVLGHAAPSISAFTVTPVLLGAAGQVSVSWQAESVAQLDLLQDDQPVSGFTPIRSTGPTSNAMGSVMVPVASLSQLRLVAQSAAGRVHSQDLAVVGIAEMELNDTTALAMTVTGTQGRVRASLSTPSDVDVYRLDVPDDGRVFARTVTSLGGCDVDTQLTLTSTDGLTAVFVDDNSGPGGCSRIDPEVNLAASGLSAGFYYLQVRSGTATSAGSYALEYSASKPRCGDGRVEGSEQCDDQNTIDGDGCSATCALEIAGLLGPAGGTLSINHPGAGVVTVAIDTNLPGQALLARANDPGAGACNTVDTLLRLVDSAGTTLGSSPGGGITGSAGTCAAIVQPQDSYAADLPVGRYYLQVVSQNGASGPVDVVASLSNPACGNGRTETLAGEQCDDGNTLSGDGCSATCRSEAAQVPEVEPNDHQISAMPTGLVGPGTVTIEGETNPSGDDDVFSVSIPAQTTLLFSARTFTTQGQPMSCDSQLTDTRIYLEQAGVEVTSPTQPGAIAFNDDIDNANNIWCSMLSAVPLSGGATGATYYLRIQGWRDIASTEYFVRFELSP